MQDQTRELQTIQLQTWQSAFQTYLSKTYDNPNTLALASQHIRVYAAWHEAQFGQELEPASITNYSIKLYRDHSLNEAKVHAATWNSRLWAISVLCQWIGIPDLLEGIKTQDASVLSEKHRSLTEKENHLLNQTLELDIRAAATEEQHYCAVRNQAITSVMLYGGLRVSEVSSLNADDIHLGERSGFVLVRNGKGGKERKIPLENKILRPVIRTWKELRGSPSTTALFMGTETERLVSRSISRIVTEMGQRIGIPDLTCHWLRYTFAKRLESNGAPIELISHLLGHNSIETTKRYLRSSLEDTQQYMG